MNVKKFLNDNDAVSPVIGVILMVAITVILAAVIGTFVLGLGDQVQSTTPQASFNFDYDSSTSNGTLTIAHGGGDTLNPNSVAVKASEKYSGNGSDPLYNGKSWAYLANSGDDIQAGSTITIVGEDVTGTTSLNDASVRIVWQATSGDSSAVLSEWSGPDA